MVCLWNQILDIYTSSNKVILIDNYKKISKTYTTNIIMRSNILKSPMSLHADVSGDSG